jgi:hypothetical protein
MEINLSNALFFILLGHDLMSHQGFLLQSIGQDVQSMGMFRIFL